MKVNSLCPVFKITFLFFQLLFFVFTFVSLIVKQNDNKGKW